MSNGRLAVPGQVAIGVSMVPAPCAHPVQVTLQTPGEIQTKVFGGLTKLEYAAIHLAVPFSSTPAAEIVARAQSLLAACAAAEQGSPEHGEKAASGAEPESPAGGTSPGGIVLP